MARTIPEISSSPGHWLPVLAVAALLGAWLVFSPAPADEPKGKTPAPARELTPAKALSSDTEFVRRIYLDMQGVLPTPDETARFLADKDPRKREKLIDQLLQKRPSLEEMLSQAMKNNPDILVAESKVREAEAKLSRTRLQVVQNIVTLRHSIDTQKSAVQTAESRFRRMKQLQGSAAVTESAVQEAEQALVGEKAKLTALEAGLPYLLGQGPGRSLAFTPDGKLVDSIWIDMGVPREMMLKQWLGPLVPDSGTILYGSAPKQASTIVDKIRKARDKQVTLDYKNKRAVDILDDLLRKIEGVPVRTLAKVAGGDMDLQFKEPLSLPAALQAWQDLSGGNGDIRLVVRDYGILVTTRALLPEGAMLLQDFWKQPAPLILRDSSISLDKEPKK